VFHCGTVATRVLAGATMRRLCRARISTREAVIIWPAHRTPARPRHSPANPGNALAGCRLRSNVAQVLPVEK
jgi:hypothetical protein